MLARFSLLALALGLAACSLAPAAEKTNRAAAAAPAGPAAPQKGLRIVEGHSGLRDTNFVLIVGELVNETGSWIEYPRIEVQLLDATGAPVSADSVASADGRGETALVEREYIGPGERGYFTYRRDAAKLSRPYASHRLTATATLNDGATRSVFEGLTQKRDPDATVEVAATFRNVGTKGCRHPALVYGKFDASGKILDSDVIYIDEWFGKDLPPGQTAQVKGLVHDHDKKVHELRFYARCAHPYT